MTPETIALLTNREVIAVDQDKTGKQGDRVDAMGPVEVWARTLADGSKAVGIFNRSLTAQTTQVDLRRLGFSKAAKARDLWLHKDLGSVDMSYSATVPAHGVVFLKLSK